MIEIILYKKVINVITYRLKFAVKPLPKQYENSLHFKLQRSQKMKNQCWCSFFVFLGL